jgi:DNA replication protein DnaC
MRTVERWDKKIKPNIIKEVFTPRIAHDLETLNIGEYDGDVVNTFIFGEVETGKTIMAAQMMLKFKKDDYVNNTGKVAVFENFSELLVQIRSAYNSHVVTEDTVLARYMFCDLLVLDDFFSIRPTDWVLEIVYRLINYRYENLKTTIITSNNSLEEIEEKIGDQRITSRINRMCNLVKKVKTF